MDFKELREKSGMTFKAFSDYFNIPMRTLQGWEYGERKCPPYVLDLMEYKLRGEKIIAE